MKLVRLFVKDYLGRAKNENKATIIYQLLHVLLHLCYGNTYYYSHNTAACEVLPVRQTIPHFFFTNKKQGFPEIFTITSTDTLPNISTMQKCAISALISVMSDRVSILPVQMIDYFISQTKLHVCKFQGLPQEEEGYLLIQ